MRYLLPSLLLLAGAASAQAPIVFDVAPNQSQWSWTGNTSIGPLNPVGSNVFLVTGDFAMEVTRGAAPIDTAQFVPGGVITIPTINAEIPGFFGVPLATVDVVGLTVEATSAPFPIGAGGGFSATVIVTALSGDINVTQVGGTTSTVPMTGLSSDPTTLVGSLTQSMLTLDLMGSINALFNFTEPTTGLTADVTLGGDLTGAWTCPAATGYCAGNTNSTGQAAFTSFLGSQRIQDGNFSLIASDVPNNQFAYFITSQTQGFSANPGGSQGNLCLGGSIGRFNAQVGQTQNNAFLINVDLNQLPTIPSSAVQPGETWNFQCWYRDANPSATSNFSGGLSVTFCP